MYRSVNSERQTTPARTPRLSFPSRSDRTTAGAVSMLIRGRRAVHMGGPVTRGVAALSPGAPRSWSTGTRRPAQDRTRSRLPRPRRPSGLLRAGRIRAAARWPNPAGRTDRRRKILRDRRRGTQGGTRAGEPGGHGHTSPQPRRVSGGQQHLCVVAAGS